MSFSAGDDSDDDGMLAEINVTPLVDVMLVLLIIFMITAPMMTAGMRVDLPQARAAAPVDRMPLVLTVGLDQRIQIGNDDITRRDLVPRLRSLMTEPNQIVHVRADKAVPYGEVVALLDELAQNGITRLSLVSQAKGREGAGKP